MSGRRDLNPGPSVPQTDTLTKLRHVPPRRGVASVGAPAVPGGLRQLSATSGSAGTKSVPAEPFRYQPPAAWASSGTNRLALTVPTPEARS
jgi:hypothetical protein